MIASTGSYLAQAEKAMDRASDGCTAHTASLQVDDGTDLYRKELAQVRSIQTGDPSVDQ